MKRYTPACFISYYIQRVSNISLVSLNSSTIYQSSKFQDVCRKYVTSAQNVLFFKIKLNKFVYKVKLGLTARFMFSDK